MKPITPEKAFNRVAFDQCDWIDSTRNDSEVFEALKPLIHEKHIKDLKNAKHAPYFEQTEDYELIIFRALDERFDLHEPETRAIAFVMFQNVVFSIHDEDDQTIKIVFERLKTRKNRRVSGTVSLALVLLSEIVDQYLKITEPLDQTVSEWQRRLLDPNDPFNDWQTIVQARSKLRRVNTTLEIQGEVLSNWHGESDLSFSNSEVVDLNDIAEHLARIERLTNGVRSDLDILAQVYFASSGQQTNKNVQLLAVISAIFLPLNFIAGLFGMNFANMPLIKSGFGAYFVVTSMVALSITLLMWFKYKKWF